METAKKHGQRHFQWPNEDTNGMLARRFLKRAATKMARGYARKEIAGEVRSG